MTTQTFRSPRFGEIEYSAQDVVHFLEGMIGFPNDKEYLVLQHREGSPFRWLQSIATEDLAFLIVDPLIYLPDYAPEVPFSAVKGLELLEDTPQLVYTVVNIPKGKPEEMTLNLAGPIVINALSRQAKQLVLEDSRYSLRHRVGKPLPKSEAA